MPYSDNGAIDVVFSGPTRPGPTAVVNLMPYNRLTVVVHPIQVNQGTLTFEGSLDGVTWYELMLKLTETGQTARNVSLGGFTNARAYSLPLEDSATAHFRINCSSNITGTNLVVLARKENT